ncbi:MAG: CPBP family intramembrane glutamic endopeptidase [Syntrophales bacterium]
MVPFEAIPEASPEPGRITQSVEVAVFVFLFLPSMLLSFFVHRVESPGFILVAVETIFQNLALVCLIFYFIWRNREPVSRIGWSRRHVWKEIGFGIILFVPFAMITALVEQIFIDAGLSVPEKSLPSFLAARGTFEYLLALLLVIVVAFAEETIYRGYLMLRFNSIMGNPAAAVLVSSGIFSLGHGYEGSAGVATVGVIGIMFAVIYLWRQSLVAPVVMHFLQDFLGIIVGPLTGG